MFCGFCIIGHSALAKEMMTGGREKPKVRGTSGRQKIIYCLFQFGFVRTKGLLKNNLRPKDIEEGFFFFFSSLKYSKLFFITTNKSTGQKFPFT